MSLVIDNSVALCWCFEDEQTPMVMSLLQRVSENGAVAPMLWALEAVNGLMMAQRRGRIDAATRIKLAGLLRALPIALDEETPARAWEATMQLSDRFALSAYDACYLELALRHALPLATLDKELAAAGRALGVEVLGK